MSSSMPTLDQTPPPPPDVAGQTGASPYAGMGAMMQKKDQGPDGGGGAHPQGALIAQGEAVKKVIDQMAKMESGFGPFADRIKSLIDAGVGSVTSGGSDSNPPGGAPSGPAAPPGPGFPG